MHSESESVPFVSVIVPFYGQPEALEPCVEGLLAQRYPTDRYEVVIVDNGDSVTPDRPLFTDPKVRIIRESREGSYAARNAGLEIAKGEILAFTDGDCVPTADWIAAGVSALDDAQSPAFVGGRIDMTYLNPDQPRVAELYDELFSSFDQQVNIEQNGFSVTANLFTRPSVFEQVGPFAAHLKSRGDLEWGERIVAAKLVGTYADDAVVGHPCRYTFAQLLAKARRLTGGHHDRAKRKNLAWLRHLKWMIVSAIVQPPINLAFARRRGIPGSLLKRLGVAVYIVTLDWLRVVERLRLTLGGRSKR